MIRLLISFLFVISMAGCGEIDWFPATNTTSSSLTITTTSLPNATNGTAYSQPLAATGGTPPYTWTLASGALPTGLTLSNGIISGTPTTTGTSSFTVQATDSSSPAQTATQRLSIQVM